MLDQIFSNWTESFENWKELAKKMSGSQKSALHVLLSILKLLLSHVHVDKLARTLEFSEARARKGDTDRNKKVNLLENFAASIKLQMKTFNWNE